MALGNQQRRSRVSVSVGVVRAEPLPDAPVPLCVIGLVPEGSPWLSERYPHAVVRPTRYQQSSAIEHLRFTGREDLAGLPGLDAPSPSRYRDAVRLAAAAGAAYLDLVLARAPGLQPWDLGEPEVTELIAGALDHAHGATLLYPDAAGPPPLGPDAGDPEPALDRLRRLIAAQRGGWVDRFQIALLDFPGADLRALGDRASADLALCRWAGSPERLRAQGWRSAAAALGGLISRPAWLVSQGADRARVPLGPGRATRSTRRAAALLGLREPDPRPPDDNITTLYLDPLQDEATVQGELSLRAPVGAWPLAALRSLKLLHLRVARAAEAFVFRPVQPLHAFALGVAVENVVRPFVAAGVLVGPDGKGAPRIGGDISRDPAAPGLVALVDGQLQPWCRAVNIRVTVRGSESASVEVSS